MVTVYFRYMWSFVFRQVLIQETNLLGNAGSQQANSSYPYFIIKMFLHFSVFIFTKHKYLRVCACLQSYRRQLLTFLIIFLVHHQNFNFHAHSTTIESITVWSVIRRFPSDFSNEIDASSLIQWPVPIFFFSFLTFFTLQTLAFQVLHNTLLQN